MAHAFARSGNRRTAEKVLSDLLAASTNDYVSSYDIAVVYAGLDDRQRTFEWLNRACDEHSGFLLFANSDPRFRPLRAERSFHDLLRRMRFPQIET